MAKEDPELTQRIRAREDEALRSVIRANLPIMLRAARATGLDADRAEDVVQELFVTFVEKAESFDGRARVRTWLFGILYRKIHEARRRIRRDEPTDEIDKIMETRFDSNGGWTRPPIAADQNLHAQGLRRQMETCLEKLADRHRSAFILREVEQLSTEEICKILDVKVNNLGVILYRARNSLRECLESLGLKGSGDAIL
jgi:RNA polymerase sigma-70 factor (ECF subfamily)